MHEEDDLKEAVNKLKTGFQARGHNECQLNKQFARINAINRK